MMCLAREPTRSYASILFEQRLAFILYGGIEGNAARIEGQERGERIDILGKISNERGSQVAKD